MSCQFSINYPGEKQEIIDKLQSAIANGGGQFNGDTMNGMFRGKTPIGDFTGNYFIDGDSINVTIDKKPFLVSCGRIEDEINKYLNQGIA